MKHLVTGWIVCKRNLEREIRADVKQTEEGDRDNLLKKHRCEVKSVTGMDAPTVRFGRGRSKRSGTIIGAMKTRCK